MSLTIQTDVTRYSSNWHFYVYFRYGYTWSKWFMLFRTVRLTCLIARIYTNMQRV